MAYWNELIQIVEGNQPLYKLTQSALGYIGDLRAIIEALERTGVYGRDLIAERILTETLRERRASFQQAVNEFQVWHIKSNERIDKMKKELQ